MDKRAAAAAATRLRIVQAAVALHGERGAIATKWSDIAKRADVALGTVYHYFPGYDELMPACTAHGVAAVGPPRMPALGASMSLRSRVSLVVDEIFRAYERSEKWLRHSESERHKIPVVDLLWQRREAMFEGMVRAALGDQAKRALAVDTAMVLTGFASWRSFHDRGVSTPTATALVTDLITRWLGGDKRDGNGIGG
jgi:AcrR family transcriptional regulator